MRLSRESQYGLMGLIVLAEQGQDVMLQVSEIAEKAQLPKAFLAKIFRKLVVGRILQSFRGRNRGFSMARPATEITIREVIEAIEGADFFDRCIFWNGRCSEASPCMLHVIWGDLRPRVAKRLELMTINDVAEPLKNQFKLKTT